VCAKKVPKNLSQDQKLNREEMCQNVLEKIPVLHHAPYSPDLVPCDFFLFPKLKHSLKGTHFQSIEDIQRKMTDLLKGFTQNDFQKCFHAWKEHMQHCIEAKGNYFEGGNLQHT
jgi:hypothetical protein